LKKYLMGLLVLIFFLLGPCSASSPQEVSDAIVTPDSQQYITEAGSKSGNNTQFQVYTQNLQGFPTNGSSFVVISSGNASGINGTPSGRSLYVGSGNSSTNGQYSNRNNFSYDIANVFFKIKLPKGAKTLSFDWKFATAENGTEKLFYQDWARVVINYAGQTYNILLLPDGKAVDVNSTIPYSNTVFGNFTPNDVKYGYVTGTTTPGVYHVTFDVSQWAGKEIELDFWVADENDGVVDSALFIDNLHISVEEPSKNFSTNVNAETLPMQKTGVPIGVLIVGLLSTLSGIIYSKKQ